MDAEPFGHISVDLLEEVQETHGPVSLVAFADDEARCDIESCELCVRRSGTPGIIGKTGCSRSSAWIWLFSSMLRTSARLGGER